MTIRRRLYLSNLMMLVVPIIVAVLVGGFCLALVFQVVEHGTQFGLESTGEFYWASQAATEMAENWAVKDHKNHNDHSDEAAIEKILDAGSLRMEVYQGSECIYSYGVKDALDAKLMEAAEALGQEGAVASVGGRSVYCGQKRHHGEIYNVYVFGTQKSGMGMNLKIALTVAGILLAFFILLAILLTNRILTRFLLRRIEEPLDVLADGVKMIGAGNLYWRIPYDRADEFKPVCDAFNEMAARLQRSVDEAKRNEESRKELFAGISHDLRSPLTSIRAYVEGLLDDIAETPEARRKYLLTIRRKAEDIDRMVNQLFTFSKLQLEEYPLELKSLRLDHFVADMVEEAASDYAEKGLEVKAEGLLPWRTEVDAEQLARVLKNIMDNSAKYKNKETGHFVYTMRRAGENMELVLTDDGPGVAKEVLAKLFDAFYRTDPARKNPAGGSGLGLAIVAKTLERMGAGVRAENAEGGGLSIIMTFKGQEEKDHEENTHH